MQLPGAGLIVLLAPAYVLLFARIHYSESQFAWWKVLPYSLIGLIVVLLAPTNFQDFGAILVYAPAMILSAFIVFILPIGKKRTPLQYWFDLAFVIFTIFALGLTYASREKFDPEFYVAIIVLLGVIFVYLWKYMAKPLHLVAPLSFVCLLAILSMLYIKSSIVSEIYAQIKTHPDATEDAINKISTKHLLCFHSFCGFDQWLMPIVLTEEMGEKSSVTPDVVAKIDAELVTEYKRSRKDLNNKMRLYGWLVGHPFDRILFSGSYGRLQALERAKASSIPDNLFWGDGSIVSSEKISRSASVLDGYQYEHAVGINLLRPLGLSGCVFILLALTYLFRSVPKENQAGRYLIAMIFFVSTWLMLQTQGVFPISGQSLPLLAVNSFAKDFFPVLMALIIYLSFFSEYSQYEDGVTV